MVLRVAVKFEAVEKTAAKTIPVFKLEIMLLACAVTLATKLIAVERAPVMVEVVTTPEIKAVGAEDKVPVTLVLFSIEATKLIAVERAPVMVEVEKAEV